MSCTFLIDVEKPLQPLLSGSSKLDFSPGKMTLTYLFTRIPEIAFVELARPS